MSNFGESLKPKIRLVIACPCADPESFVRGSPTLTRFCSEGREDPSTTISGPSSARQRNAIKLRFAGVLMIAKHRMLAG